MYSNSSIYCSSLVKFSKSKSDFLENMGEFFLWPAQKAFGYQVIDKSSSDKVRGSLSYFLAYLIALPFTFPFTYAGITLKNRSTSHTKKYRQVKMLSPCPEEEFGFNMKKQILFETIILYTRIKPHLQCIFGWHVDTPWNEIPLPSPQRGKLFLGALPLQNDFHELTQKMRINVVISITESFENDEDQIKRGWFFNPITPKEWVKAGVKHIQIYSVDLKPVKLFKIATAVDMVSRTLRKEMNIYVHCKAGKSRSGLIVLGYLMRDHNMSFKEAYQYVKSFRRQLFLTKQQKNVAILYESQYC